MSYGETAAISDHAKGLDVKQWVTLFVHLLTLFTNFSERELFIFFEISPISRVSERFSFAETSYMPNSKT